MLYSERLKDAHKYPSSASGSPLAFSGGGGGGDGGGGGGGGEGGGRGSSGPADGTPGGGCAAGGTLGSREEWEEEVEQWKQVISILQEGGHFSGINRKAQLKPLAWEAIPRQESGGGGGDGERESTEPSSSSSSSAKVGGPWCKLKTGQPMA